MPSRNSIKEYSEECYYHLYNRGASKQTIFHDDEDYVYFLYLLKRLLSPEPVCDKYGREYKNLHSTIQLVAYCLMPNHFHLLVLNKERMGIEQLMRSLITAYSMYYNRKYDHSGRLFQGAYKATLIDSDGYLQHISRYIHRNPKNYRTYKFSSYRAIVESWSVEWLSNILMDSVFEGTIVEYIDFVSDLEDYKETLEDISLDLADR